MNSAEVFDLIEQIAATSSKKEKEALVKKGMTDPMFAGVMKDAYDPFKVYNVTRATLDALVLPPATGDSLFDDGTWNLIIALYERTVTGDEAKASIASELARLDPKSAELLCRILCKDMRAGFSESTINKAAPGTIPEFPYMRCSLPDKSNMDSWNWADGMISQEKADGMFMNLNYYVDDAIHITSRQGTPFPLVQFDFICGFVRKHLPAGYQYHGEALVFDRVTNQALPRENSNGIMNSVASGGEVPPENFLVYCVWDGIPLDKVKSKGKHETPYKTRVLGLALALKDTGNTGAVRLIDSRVVRSKAEAYAHCNELQRKGKEGTVVKHPEAIWKDGTSKDQVKLKLEVDVDLVAKAIVPGRVGTKNEGRPGSITMETSCGQLKVDVTVKNEAMRDAIEKDPDSFLERIYPVRANSVLNPSESSPLHSLFLPRLVEAEPRIDKSEADSLERVKEQFAAAIA